MRKTSFIIPKGTFIKFKEISCELIEDVPVHSLVFADIKSLIPENNYDIKSLCKGLGDETEKTYENKT